MSSWKQFLILTNPEKDPGFEVTDQLILFLRERGLTCISSRQLWGEDPGSLHHMDDRSVPEGTDCIISLGGDGTLIRAARDLCRLHIPIFGVNLGKLGYLTEIDRSNLFSAIEEILQGRYYTEERMMLKGQIVRKDRVIYENAAMNDIVLSRVGTMRAYQFDVSVNGEFLSRYYADGMIVSTPTGSTAYNLSVGGPIVMPEACLFVMTPIAAHTLNTRSIVLPAEVQIELSPSLQNCADTEAAVYFDGDICITLEPEDRVRLMCSETKVKLVKRKRTSFLETLRRKMIRQ